MGSFSYIFLALYANLNVESVSAIQPLEGETQQMIKLLPEPLNEGSNNFVSFESRKGICGDLSANLEMQFVS
jgi:hypothetical protein